MASASSCEQAAVATTYSFGAISPIENTSTKMLVFATNRLRLSYQVSDWRKWSLLLTAFVFNRNLKSCSEISWEVGCCRKVEGGRCWKWGRGDVVYVEELLLRFYFLTLLQDNKLLTPWWSRCKGIHFSWVKRTFYSSEVWTMFSLLIALFISCHLWTVFISIFLSSFFAYTPSFHLIFSCLSISFWIFLSSSHSLHFIHS